VILFTLSLPIPRSRQLQHGGNRVRQRAAKKLRPGELNHRLQRVLHGALVTTVEPLGKDVLELATSTSDDVCDPLALEFPLGMGHGSDWSNLALDSSIILTARGDSSWRPLGTRDEDGTGTSKPGIWRRSFGAASTITSPSPGVISNRSASPGLPQRSSATIGR
jgi:hypothetical protein